MAKAKWAHLKNLKELLTEKVIDPDDDFCMRY